MRVQDIVSAIGNNGRKCPLASTKNCPKLNLTDARTPEIGHFSRWPVFFVSSYCGTKVYTQRKRTTLSGHGYYQGWCSDQIDCSFELYTRKLRPSSPIAFSMPRTYMRFWAKIRIASQSGYYSQDLLSNSRSNW